MSRRGEQLLTMILAGACGVLFVLALAFEFGVGAGYSWLPADTDTAADGANAIDRSPFKLPPENDFAVVYQRPLFNEDRKPAPDRFPGRPHDLEPVPDERADLLSDLETREPLRREPSLQRAVHLLNVDVDHPRLRLGHGEPGLNGIDAELCRRAVNRRLGPAIEHRILSDRQGKAAAQLLERTRRIHEAQLGSRAWRRKPRSGNLTSTSAAAMATAPMPSVRDSVSR